MIAYQNLIDELETAFATKTLGRRADAIRRVTDLFLTGSGQYREEVIDLFDEIFGRLYRDIALASRIELAKQLADVADAPVGLMRKMARDDAIEVAGPVLSRSIRLDDGTLVEIAMAKSQEHLLAIAQREVISEKVTDILVARGDRTVALIAVRNSGARFSRAGYTELVTRSGADDRLAVGIWLCEDMPHPHLLRLFAEASAIVKAKLEIANPERTRVIRDVVADIADTVRATAREGSRAYQTAHAEVRSRRRPPRYCQGAGICEGAEIP